MFSCIALYWQIFRNQVLNGETRETETVFQCSLEFSANAGGRILGISFHPSDRLCDLWS